MTTGPIRIAHNATVRGPGRLTLEALRMLADGLASSNIPDDAEIEITYGRGQRSEAIESWTAKVAW